MPLIQNTRARVPWLLSKQANTVLAALSWGTFASVIGGISCSLAFRPGETYLGNSLDLKILFWLAFGFLTLVVLGEFFLWFSMLWFCIRWYKGAVWKRLVAILSQLIFFSWASAVLYFLLYRHQFRTYGAREQVSA